jgi:PhzF family phenazine biosynthesis protein
MKIPIYIVDSFAGRIFTGNPAAVCPLDKWMDDTLMQNIAMENNLSETAFFVMEGEQYAIRWFTPVKEVYLAGHPTLAAAHVLFSHLNYVRDEIIFTSQAGVLKVRKENGLIVLNFPSDDIEIIDTPEFLAGSFQFNPVETVKGIQDYMFCFETQKQVEEAVPDLAKIAKGDARGLIITAPGDECDFVSRYFAPQFGINEDPVTGSAHTTLTPYWHNKTGKTEMKAIQLSKRRGWLTCKYLNERVEISGKAFTYSIGKIEI